MLPIVQRELRVSARNPQLYARRLRWGALQAVAAWAVLMFSGGGFRRASAEWFFGTVSHFALFFCLIEGVRKTSDAIATEKREGTLGLLFLSTLTGADVILGKFGSAVVRSLSGLLTFVPVMAISLLVGGTTLGEFWRVSLALIGVLLEALALCLLVSTVSRERAVAASIIALVAINVLPLAAGFGAGIWRVLALLSPIALIRAARDLWHARAPGEFWFGLGVAALVTTAALGVASFLLPRIWQERRGFRGKALVRRARAEHRAKWLARNPVLWLTYSRLGAKWLKRLALVLLLAGTLPLIALFLKVGESKAWLVFPATAGWILMLLIWLRVAIQSATTISEEKENGSLELLLTTPISVAEVIEGHWLAVWIGVRFAVFCGVALLFSWVVVSHKYFGPLVTALIACFEGAVLASIGFWMGLTSKNRATAVVYTLLLGMAPSMCALALPLQVFLFFRGRNRVRRMLSEMRWNGGQRIEDLLRATSPPNPNVPPVIRYTAGQRT